MTTSSTDYHRDLSLIARLLPRKIVTPRSAVVLQRMTTLMERRAPTGVETLTLTSGVRVRLYRPRTAVTAGPALLWIHGGGYVIGSAAQDDSLCRRFADTLGATVASVDYRLAPQHPYPAGLHDCYQALCWLAELPAVDAGRIAIGGASAGGGMAAAWRCWPGTAAKSPRRPSCWCTRCSTIVRWERISTIRRTGCGRMRAIGSAGRPISAGPTRRWPCRPAAPIWPDCPRPG